MDYDTLSKHFTLDKLDVMIGELDTDGKVTYKETNLNFKKNEKK